jgi:hypothetical protein
MKTCSLKKGSVLIVKINRGRALNALTKTVAELQQLFSFYWSDIPCSVYCYPAQIVCRGGRHSELVDSM